MFELDSEYAQSDIDSSEWQDYDYNYDASKSEKCDEDYNDCGDYVDSQLKRSFLPRPVKQEAQCDPEKTGDEHCVCSG